MFRAERQAVRSAKRNQPHPLTKQIMEELLLKYRKDNFAVKVMPARYPQEDGEISLAITTKGNQWTTITLLKSEVEKVIAALSSNSPTP
jgi:hypothetical protein